MLAFAFGLAFPAEGAAAPMAATAIKVTGKADFVSAADGRIYIAEKGTKLAEGDIAKTGPASQLVIEFENKNRIQLGENTELTIRASRIEPDGSYTSIFGLSIGKVRSFVTKFTPGSSKFEYQTKTAVAGVAGTDFITEVPTPDATTVAVLPPGVDEETTPSPSQGSSFCGRPERQGHSKVYVQGMDDAKSTVYLTSCFMTTVTGKRAPAQPTIIPDDMLFNIRKSLATSPLAADNLMIEDLSFRVSTPFARPGVNSLLHNLDTNLGHGGGGGPGAGAPPTGAVVGGSAVITIK